MEIYNNKSDAVSQEFIKLLNTSFSKTNIEEGKIIEGKISKITDKYIYLEVPNMKSEPILDRSEIKSLGLEDKCQVGAKLKVLIERLEDKAGNVVVSATKAHKIEGWQKLIEHYEKEELITGRITARCKGGAIVEHIDTGSLMFLPGSQISDKPLKDTDFTKLMNEPQKFKLIKLDRQRGNACVSRREVISSSNKDSKAKLISKYNVGDIIKDAECKSITSFGAFLTVDGSLDILCHIHEASYSRISHPEEIFEVGKKYDVAVISKDEIKQQLGVSRKKIFPDPFDDIDNYAVNTKHEVTIDKITDFGAFCSLKPGLSTLLHNSQISWTKKNASVKKMFKVGMKIPCIITDINKDDRRIAISYRLTQPNEYEVFTKKYPVGTIAEATVVSKNEYALFVKFEDKEVENVQIFLHMNNITYDNNVDEEFAKYTKGSKITVKVLEIIPNENKVRAGARECGPDPFVEYFKDKAVSQTITVKVKSSDAKGLLVVPEGTNLEFPIKKSNIAISSQDARSSRFVNGDRIDCAIAELSLPPAGRKVTLSMKLLEEIQKKEVLEKYGAEGSGKNLPFSSLAEDLKKKDKK